MASESEANEMQAMVERLISSRNRDLSLFIPFLLGFTSYDAGTTRPESDQNSGDPDHNSGNNSTPDDQNQRDRIILINPLTQGMVVIEGTGLDSLFRCAQQQEKSGPPPASKSSIEAMPSVEILEGEEAECVVCLEDWEKGIVVKEMPCKHRFHGGCIEKWLKLHGSCPVCRFAMPVEEEGEGKKGEEREESGERRRIQREIWVSLSFGNSGRRRREEESGNDASNNSSDSSDQSSDGLNEMGN